MLSKQAIQTGMIVFVLTVCIQEQAKRSNWLLRNKISYSKASSDWSQRTANSRSRKQGDLHNWSYARMRINAIDFKLPKKVTRVCVFFLVILIDSCVSFAKYVEFNHTHKEKVFHGKVWHIISRSGTEISVPAVPTQKTRKRPSLWSS